MPTEKERAEGDRKRVLLIAFHFPPVKGSTGLHRTLSMARYLREFGWEPIVLTADPRAYGNTSDELLQQIPPDVRICRAFALDTRQHLSVMKRYPQWLATPDRWKSWWLGGVVSGRRLIRELQPDLLWSTYPVPTAHSIGYSLHRTSRIPWVADFRDPMYQDSYPSNERVRQSYRRIEQKVVAHASQLVFTTPGAAQEYVERYPDLTEERVAVVENAVDEDFFASIEKQRMNKPRTDVPDRKIRLIHSGILYRSERDPSAFFAALQKLKQSGKITSDDVEIVLRASTQEDFYRQWVAELGIDDLVFFKSGIPYAEAIEEMISADGLLIFQARNCNRQIPAKIYEYFRSGRPILGLTDPIGDTAMLLKSESGTVMANLADADDIAHQLPDFIDYCRGYRDIAVRRAENQFSRRKRVGQFAELFDILNTER